MLAVAPPLALVLFRAFRVYVVHRITPAEEFRRLVLAITIWIGIVVTLSFWADVPLTRLGIAATWLLSFALVLGFRRGWHLWIGRERAHGRLAFRTLVVGTNDEAVRVVHSLRETRSYEPVAFVSTGNGLPRIDGMPVVGTLEELATAIATTGSECVLVAASAVTTEQMRRVSRIAHRRGVELRISANLPEVLWPRVSAQPLGGVMMLALDRPQFSPTQAVLKRSLDLVGAVVGLVVMFPVLAVTAAAVKLASPGPVLFRQERIGRRGRPFVLLKFRTMVVGAHALREGLVGLNEASEPLFKVARDPRLHRLGRFLRRWSIDELPQLWNVLRGEMSLVGPRPALGEETARYADWHHERLEVRPGITGLWQVSGRSELPFDDYVRLDLFYIENWSLAYDLFILTKTVPAVLSGRGAR